MNGVLRHPADCGAVLFWTQSGFIARILTGHLRVPPRGARHTGSAIRYPSTGSKVIPGSITSANSFRQSTGNSVGIPFGSWRLTGRRENRLPATTGEPSRTAGTRSAPMGFWWSSSEIRAAQSSICASSAGIPQVALRDLMGSGGPVRSLTWQSGRVPPTREDAPGAPAGWSRGPRGCPMHGAGCAATDRQSRLCCPVNVCPHVRPADASSSCRIEGASAPRRFIV